MFGKDMDRDYIVQFYIELSPIGIKTNKRLRLIDIKMNMCDVLSTKFDISLVQKIMIEVRRTGNIPFQCPFKKVLLIYTFIMFILASDLFVAEFFIYHHQFYIQ